MIECFAENNCIQANLCVLKKKKVCRKWVKEERKKEEFIGMKHI